MNTLTIILIVLTAALLIANIVMFTIEHTKKHKLSFDKSKTRIILVASENTREILESDNEMTKKYCVLNSSNGYFKTEHGSVFIKAYLVEGK